MSVPRPVLAVDGEIGVGKSTLVKRIQERPRIVEAVLGDGYHVVPVLECVKAWQDVGAFQLMVANKTEWGEEFQHLAMLTRITKWVHVAQQYEHDPKAVLLVERAPPADRLVFTHVLHQRGDINDAGLALHHSWYERLWAKRPAEFSHVGVLMCNDDSETKRRIQRRDRCGEDAYEWDYLSALHKRYAEVVQTDEWPMRNQTVMLDADEPFHQCDRALARVFAALMRKSEPPQVECACSCCK